MHDIAEMVAHYPKKIQRYRYWIGSDRTLSEYSHLNTLILSLKLHHYPIPQPSQGLRRTEDCSEDICLKLALGAAQP